METLDVFRSSVLYSHEDLASRFDRARAMTHSAEEPRKGFEDLDTFLAVASKHLNAVDAALLPSVSASLDDSTTLVHDYLAAARGLELALNHLKARAYGSVFQMGRAWPAVWSEVENALDVQRSAEFSLAEKLSAVLADAQLESLAERLHGAERSAPTRPHPYLPHVGIAGKVARRMVHTVDSFWDTVEGRMVPEPVRPPHARPGPMAQYFLADPHFEPRSN